MKLQLNFQFNFFPVILLCIPLLGNVKFSTTDENPSPTQSAKPLSKTSVFKNVSWQYFVSNYLKKQYFIKTVRLTKAEYRPYDNPQLIFSRKNHTDYINRRLGLNQEQPKKAQRKQSLKHLLSNFEPSVLQLKILSHFIQSQRATQLDLYPILTDSLPILFEEFNQHLDELAEKGFLTKKKISPQLLFTFFYFPVEISQKNRKNPVYLYELNVEEAEIKSYLQTKQIDSYEAQCP